MTAKEFYEKHKNKKIDMDFSPKGDIYQCVDLFKAFTKENFNTNDYTTGNGYASGLWINRKSKPYYKYFVEANKNKMQNGDWVFWGKSKATPSTHVAMYYDGKFLGQNQNGKKEATLVKISKDGILGVLRPKIYVKNSPNNAQKEKVDQILHKGSKVRFNGTFLVDKIDIKNNTWCNYSLIGGKPTKPYHWLPSTPFDNVNGKQIIKPLDKVRNKNTYIVQAVDQKTNSAKLIINGRTCWIKSKYLKEV